VGREWNGTEGGAVFCGLNSEEAALAIHTSSAKRLKWTLKFGYQTNYMRVEIDSRNCNVLVVNATGTAGVAGVTLFSHYSKSKGSEEK
jgi:hypothetical protein